MSGSESMRQMVERILLGAVVVLAVVTVFRLVSQEPASETQAPKPVQLPVAPAMHAVAEVQLSPACSELLARIRSCSGPELDAIVDKVSAIEAYNLYRQLSPNDRQAVFAALPVPVLARKTHRVLGIPETVFRAAHRPGSLAASLLDAAMGAPSVPVAPRRQTLSFATGLDPEDAPERPRSRFRPEEQKIYACLDAGPDLTGERGVLVRWTEEASGTLVYLHYLPLEPGRRWNYIFFAVDGTWTPGTYRVSCYRIGESTALLADGTYQVAVGD